MKIYVLRHGTTELNKQKILNGQIDEGLAPEGIELAKNIQLPKTVTHIYSSPMLRTRQTTAIVSQPQTKIIFADAIREVNMGTLAGKSWHLMENGQALKIKHRSIQYDYREIGGESATDVKNRVKSFLKKINNQYQDYEVML
ncbi:MAG TPA: histidine phosphatase family protein, partial [Patescibacteria group bacterium]